MAAVDPARALEMQKAIEQKVFELIHLHLQSVRYSDFES